MPVNKRRPFAVDLCYPFPELKPEGVAPYPKRDPVLFRVRQPSKILNTQPHHQHSRNYVDKTTTTGKLMKSSLLSPKEAHKDKTN